MAGGVAVATASCACAAEAPALPALAQEAILSVQSGSKGTPRRMRRSFEGPTKLHRLITVKEEMGSEPHWWKQSAVPLAATSDTSRWQCACALQDVRLGAREGRSDGRLPR